MYIRGTSRAFHQVARCHEYTITGARQAVKNGRCSLPVPWTRGAKRKTTLKINDLPQGALPPLAKIESEEATRKSYPPVLQGHLNNVRQFKDCVVLTRVGDFYEMYFDQVDQYAALVGLKKAKRATVLGDVAMAGFQHTQLDRYLKMFVQDLGTQVAISEQIPIPEHERVNRAGAALYDRKVTRVITSGTLIDESFIAPFENNFLLAVHFDDSTPTKPQKQKSGVPSIKVGLGWLDLSSGEFQVQTADVTALPTLIARINPREIVLSNDLRQHGPDDLQKILGEGMKTISYHDHLDGKFHSTEDWLCMLEPGVVLPKDFTAQEVVAGNMILDYVVHRLFNADIKLQPPIRRAESEYMAIDKHSLRALEIKSTLRDGFQQGSLLHAIRRTTTNSGARLLSQRIVSPSMSLKVINHRLDLVQEMLEAFNPREDVVALLKDTSDTFRLLQRFSIGKGDADDMLGLAKTIQITQRMADVLILHQADRERRLVAAEARDTKQALPRLDASKDIIQRLDLVAPLKLANEILSAIDEDSLSQRQRIEIERAEQSEKLANEVVEADNAWTEGPKLARRLVKSTSKGQSDIEDSWIMRKSASSALKDAHNNLASLFEKKQTLIAQLRARLGAESLTLRWSPQYGHHCHIKGKDATKSVIPVEGARSFMATKTTRSFYAQDWTSLGQEIDSAKSRIRAEEDSVFSLLKAHVLENLMKLRRNAAVLDELDVACSSATVAKERSLIRPILNEGYSHNIIGGRHPTVDVGLLNQGKQFTSNDCSVGTDQLIYLITGPNMAGKSTYLRQNALITILAQTGCYVPAQYAELGLVDKVFSRVGSADSLFQDQSTFMVEMLETAEILKQATPRSFVIMDEVGRGTTPQDGVAVGYACLHHLHYNNRCRSLFATHFHSLAEMTEDFPKLGRYCTDVAELEDGTWMYVHKLKPGVNRESHALKVARMAGLPEAAIEVAAKVLQNMPPAPDATEDVQIAVAA